MRGMQSIRLWGALYMTLFLSGPLQAQQAPDTILYNGKIVTVDNHEVNGNLGTIAQAVAIREGKIVAVGSNDQVRRLAGSTTKSLDLKGKVVIPGIALTHDHPQDWDPLNPYIVKKVVTDDMHIERFLDDPPQQQLEQFPRVLDEAVHKAKPGQWIRISMLFGPEYRWRDEITSMLGRQIPKQMLDQGAPNNPVIVRADFVGVLINQKAIEVTKEYYGDQFSKFVGNIFQNNNIESQGTCGTCYREVEQDVLYPPDVLREIYRLGLSWMSGYGQTINATSLYTGGAIRAYNTLDRMGQMAMRMGWGWYWPYRNDFFQDPYFVQAQVAREGTGSDYFWVTGMTSRMGGACSKLEPTRPEVKARDCASPGFSEPLISRALYEYVKAGGRLAGDHMIGDHEIDLVLDIIEKASKDGGMTADQIRSKRHVTEHMHMYPRPDQIPRFKNLGMMTSGWDFTIWEGGAFSPTSNVLDNYGERAVSQMVPRKSLNEAGVMNSMELDRAIAATNLTLFHVLYSGITRKDWDGRVLGPQQAVSREAMLKSATLWGAYGVQKDKVLGSLESGKLADLMILDKDYLTIPVDEIKNIRVLMTMLGGKVTHLVPSLAREFGMQPAGAQVELGGLPSKW
ncbi:MAG: amidohydrolase family protein [Acidobacteria bacterium]|nr:amidohydrolase family protein [Acidobacteriota bacterium]